MATATQEQILAGYAASNAAVRTSVLNYAALAWNASPSYRANDVDRIVRQVVPQVQAGQKRIATLTALYIASVASLRQGRPISAIGVDPIITMLRGVDPFEVYRRPAKTVYKELAKGKPFDDAVEAGARRMVDIVSADLQLAKRWQARESFEASGAKFYRRVLTGNENCAMCVIASTQRYFSNDLMPIHPGCDCNEEEIDANQDPGQIIDPTLLEDTHARVAEFVGEEDRAGRAPDYRKLLITHEHGELGPVMAWHKDHFTGPTDLAP